MSKIRNLPAKTTLDANDLFYVVDSTVGANGGRKITTANVKSALSLTAAEVKSLYESNANTNAYTDAEKSKLAGIESGATADQNASEVPYDNSTSGLSATNVKDALDETADIADGGFSVSIVSGLIVHYTAGHIRVEDTFYNVLAGDILLAANITLGEIYVDVDGVVKQTGSGGKTPPGAYPIAIFSTNLISIIALNDARVRSNQNLLKAQLADITSVSPDGAAAIGATNRYADAAHKHTIPTASAIGLDANSANGAGDADSVARSNHTHAIATDIPVTQNADQANAAGASAALAKADHIHNIPTAAPVQSNANGTNSQGVANTFAKSDHKHDIATAAPSTQNADQANAAGSSSSLSRADHVHNIPTAAASGLNSNSTNTQGVANTFAKSDHTHAIASGAPSTQNADQANAAGSSATFAKADHIHNIPTAAASGLNVNSTNTQGAANTFAKSDHTHAIASGAPSTQNADQANAAGSSANFAKADHIHNIPTATPTDTGTANAQGSANTFAKSDHVHNTVIANSSVTATADDTTASGVDNGIAGMSITPAAGTYFVSFSTSVNSSANGATRMFVNIYSGGAQVAHSERQIGISGGANASVHTQAVVTVNGSQAIEARWRAAAGTATAHQRSLTIIRLGP